APERGQRVRAPDELVGLGADHVSGAVELTVEQQPTDVTRAAQEGEKALAREPLRNVAAPVHQLAPDGSDRGVARPDEERPAPVPAPSEILTRGPARRRTPEHEEAARPAERLERGQRTRPRHGRPQARPRLEPPPRGEIDLDDLGARGRGLLR